MTDMEMAWDILTTKNKRIREVEAENLRLELKSRRLEADYEWLQAEIGRIAADLRQEEPESFLAVRLERLKAIAAKS